NGELKFFEYLLENGTSAVLKSTIPPVTAPAWSSLVTGKNPGKHGVFSFLMIDKYGNARVVNSRSIKSATFWEVASIFGKKVCVINVPLTYPPKEVNGIIVPGMLTPPNKLIAYPLFIVDFLKKHSYLVDIYKLDIPKELLFEKILLMVKTRLNVSLKLFEIDKWDLFVVTFVAPDRVQHKFWNNSQKISEVYREIDDALKKLITVADKDYIVVIFSDHGFTSVKRKIKMNLWLARKGYLKVGKRLIGETLPSWPSILKERKDNILKRSVKKILSLIANICEATGIDICKIWPNSIPLHYSIDFERSLAYFTHHEAYGIHIMKSEKVVDYETIRNRLIRDLTQAKDPITDEKLFKNVFRREEIYWGRYLQYAPDIILVPTRYESIFDPKIRCLDDNFVESYNGGFHDENGIFIMYGDGIRSGSLNSRVNIFDVAPTILHILGVPIPADVDGRVLIEAYDDHNPLKFTEPKFISSRDLLKIKVKTMTKLRRN
ncbi:MAG: hypothetical protein B6U76_06220, partial [Desulfurococcales archaeon ex4484_217_2]